uniref:Uncharacterized protein n=1 Tax=Roseihalotalea indica TaxID=2867963 RepID=A0AA49JKB7_9BACT|nr:hypothetical protein K4G66_16180 [Tunicatimonas sp. TK19036]
MRIVFFAIAFVVGNFLSMAGYSQASTDDSKSYLNLVLKHYNKQLQNGIDTYGSTSTAFWMSSLSTATGKYPEDDSRPSDRPQRLYETRPIEAPQGSNIYWDMPQITVAYYLSKKTGDSFYANAADAYIQAFLANCISEFNGRFTWGNHFYYDAYKDAVIRFGSDGNPLIINVAEDTVGLHELRPIVPSWDALWEIDSEATEAEIRSAIEGHLTNPSTGRFNRHASGNAGLAFLEAGGIMVHMLSWLYQKTQDVTLLDKAYKIANYSFEHQGDATGLLENSPDDYGGYRWDAIYSTTEVGLWSRDLLASVEYVNDTTRQRWISMADAAMSAWLQYGFDPERCNYYGILRVENGEPVFDEDYRADFPNPTDQTSYRPDNYTSLWEPLFPRHDYPMPFAESCLELYKLTDKDQYKAACYRWLTVIQNDLPAWDGEGGYADLYGRVIHFLMGSYETFHDERFRLFAQKVADEAVSRLYVDEDGMFRTHTNDNRYDTADMFGLLAASLIWVETGEEPDMMGIFY